MHSFLRSIGFSERHITEYDIKKLLDDIYPHYEQMVSVIGKDRKTVFMELSKSFGKGFGLRVCGEQDPYGFHRLTYFPYLSGSGVTSEENVAIQMRASGDSYSGIVDDGRVGMSLIFALQNPGDYRRELQLGTLEKGRISTTLSALALSGMILLPVQENKDAEEENLQFYNKRSRLVAAAKSGNPRAMEQLTIQDMDLYTMLERRTSREDILSIVETYFMPYGMECDQYRILGKILEIREERNMHTEESVVILTLLCNGMRFPVCINRKDIIGEPTIGCRFKGNIWLQGRINFRQKSREKSAQIESTT